MLFGSGWRLNSSFHSRSSGRGVLSSGAPPLASRPLRGEDCVLRGDGDAALRVAPGDALGDALEDTLGDALGDALEDTLGET